MYLFGAVLGAPGGRVGGAALFAGAAMAFLLLHRVWRQEETAAWVASRHRQARWALVSSGVGLACMSVVAGAAVGPQLPGSGSGGLASLDGLSDEEQTRVVISPLVDIQSRLVDQSNLQVFTVQTDEGAGAQGAYWRLTALDDFDGSIWRSSYETDDASSELPRSVPPDVTTRTMTQTITVQSLAQIWLPAAYEPMSVDTGDTEVDYDPASSTLIVDREAESSDGLTYTVTSEIPTWTPEQLRQASLRDLPGDIAERYLALPEDVSDGRIAELARRLSRAAATPYDKAIALQSHLRNFEYTLDVQPGHGDNALEAFLFENRRGYCEQFAGAFAAMARSIDIPSRVVVGFTKGIQDPNEPGLYRVNGEHAHAWVELYFPGYGWVTFDPTPTRGPPGASDWLGIPEQQQDATDNTGTVATTAPGGQPAPGTPTPGSPTPPDPGDRGGVEVSAPEEEEEASDDETSLLDDLIDRLGRPLAGVVGGYVSLVPLGLVIQRAVRRRRARAPVQQVRLAWQDVTDEIRAAGLRLSDALTVAERAARMRAAMPEVATDIDLLARVMEQATYAERPPSPEDVAMVASAAGRVTAAVARRQPWWRRIGRYLDVRRLLPRRETARRSAHGAARSTEGAAQPA
jgi:transglutaminase-like putative cysteine protease